MQVPFVLSLSLSLSLSFSLSLALFPSGLTTSNNCSGYWMLNDLNWTNDWVTVGPAGIDSTFPGEKSSIGSRVSLSEREREREFGPPKIGRSLSPLLVGLFQSVTVGTETGRNSTVLWTLQPIDAYEEQVCSSPVLSFSLSLSLSLSLLISFLLLPQVSTDHLNSCSDRLANEKNTSSMQCVLMFGF